MKRGFLKPNLDDDVYKEDKIDIDGILPSAEPLVFREERESGYKAQTNKIARSRKDKK